MIIIITAIINYYLHNILSGQLVLLLLWPIKDEE